MLMWKKRNNYLLNQTLLLGITLILSACNKNGCSGKFKDQRTINEFYVLVDSCKVYKGSYFHQYFDNKGLFMSGYGDRFLKQHTWSYFEGNEKVANGKFVNGIPIGNWRYKNFENLSWRIFSDTLNGFQVSIPSSWVLKQNRKKNFMSVSMSKKNQLEANFNIIVANYNHNLSEYLKKSTDSLLENNEIGEMDSKELSIDSLNEAFQRKFKIENKDYKMFVFQTFYARKDKRKVWIITINSDYNSFRKNLPFFDTMLGSFKFN